MDCAYINDNWSSDTAVPKGISLNDFADSSLHIKMFHPYLNWSLML